MSGLSQSANTLVGYLMQIPGITADVAMGIATTLGNCDDPTIQNGPAQFNGPTTFGKQPQGITGIANAGPLQGVLAAGGQSLVSTIDGQQYPVTDTLIPPGLQEAAGLPIDIVLLGPPNNPQWFNTTTPGVIIGNLTADLVQGSHAAFQTLEGNAPPFDVYDCLLQYGNTMPSGSHFVAVLNPGDGKWYVAVPFAPESVLFGILTADLSAGSSATMTPDGAGSGITIYDKLMYAGTKIVSGSNIVVAFNRNDRRYYLVSPITPQQLQYRATLTGNLASGSSATATIATTSASVTVYDWMIPATQTLASGTKIWIGWDDGKWWAVSGGDCPT
jgi:hypothetical protein